MIFSIHNIIDLIINALYNTLCYEAIEIKEIKLVHDIDNIYYLYVSIKDTDVFGSEYVRFSISLRENNETMKINSVYLSLKYEDRELQTITPYYYEGLNELRVTLSNILCNLEILHEELKQYE